MNVFYGAVTAGSHTPGEVIAQIAGFIEQLYETVFEFGNFSASWHMTYQTITYRDDVDSIVRLRVADAHDGEVSGAAQDAQVAYLINWGTGDPRRGGKPRNYICGVPQGATAGPANLQSSLVDDVNGRLVPWLESGPGLTIPLQLVEMSFRNGDTWRADAQTYPIIGGTLNPVVATQRRRIDRLRPS